MGDGPEFCIDLRHDYVVCCNYLGSPYGSASPVTSDPAKSNGGVRRRYSGIPYGGDFPTFTIRDQALANKMVMDRLGVTHCKLVRAEPPAGFEWVRTGVRSLGVGAVGFVWGLLLPCCVRPSSLLPKPSQRID